MKELFKTYELSQSQMKKQSRVGYPNNLPIASEVTLFATKTSPSQIDALIETE